MGQTLTEIKGILAARGLHPKKRFGQNFLHDFHQLERIVRTAEIEAGELVLEVGPGTGALTERLVEAGAKVIAVEVDHDMCGLLRERLGDAIELHEVDVLDSKHALAVGLVERLRGERFKLIANLPYNISSPLLATLVTDWPGMAMAVVMVQKEAADRYGAESGGKEYGALSVLLQAMCAVEVVGVLPPDCFWPRPKVASAVVKVERRADHDVKDAGHLSRVLGMAFSRRRKQMGAILRDVFGRDAAEFFGGTFDGKRRPEQLDVGEWVRLAEEVNKDWESLADRKR